MASTNLDAFVPAAPAQTPKTDEPALSPNPNVTPPVTAADYSVFEIPAVRDPLPPPEARGLGPVPVVPKFQPPASPQASLPVSDDHIILWKSPQSRQEFINPGHSLEERLGLKGILLLALSAGILVFILGYVVFLTLLTSFN
jgi:hypothetical protein